VILDVVYNHLGPSGNFLGRFDRRWQSARHANEWGAALNFDDEGGAAMRRLLLSNVRYWIREFHFDGFRVDAAQQIFDDSADHVLAALGRCAREAAGARNVLIVAEHEGQNARLIRAPAVGGYGLDAIFNEDFHHSCRVALTGVREAYFSDYAGTSREWLGLVERGFLFQGQYYPWQKQPRGTPALDCDAAQFVGFLENHDQVANSAAGLRLIDLAGEPTWRALTAFLLLGPWTPLLFQGQESGSDTPFRYFADHGKDLHRLVVKGRRAFLGQFTRFRGSAGPVTADPAIGEDVFEACRMGRETSRAERCVLLHADLLAMRRHDPSLGQRAERILGATAGDRTLLLRFVGRSAGLDRLLVINLAPDMNLAALPDPVVAPPRDQQWHIRWCSEDPRYGGGGVPASAPPATLIAGGHAATLFDARGLS
jgi:maltooligosyltrehalose trehalohydrolase